MIITLKKGLELTVKCKPRSLAVFTILSPRILSEAQVKSLPQHNLNLVLTPVKLIQINDDH